MGWRLSGVLAAVILGAASAAPAADSDSLAGVYRFTTTAEGADGEPVCTEQWTLGADGALIIVSGQERIEGRWRTEKEGSLHWLVETDRRSNHAPDCQGKVRTTTAPELRLFYWVNNSGVVHLCAPPQMVNGSPYISECYAWLRPES